MNETPKGKLARLVTKANRDGYNHLSNADIEWLLSRCVELEKVCDDLKNQLDFVNNEQQMLTHRLQAQVDQVFRNV